MSGHACQFQPVSSGTPTYFMSMSACHHCHGMQTIKLQCHLHWPWGWLATHTHDSRYRCCPPGLHQSYTHYIQRQLSRTTTHLNHSVTFLTHHCWMRGLCLSKQCKLLTRQLQDFSNHVIVSTRAWAWLHSMCTASVSAELWYRHTNFLSWCQCCRYSMYTLVFL